MKLDHALFSQIRTLLPWIGLILLMSALFLGGALFLDFWRGVPFAVLTRDPVSVGSMPVYVGFISQIGIFFWSAAATLCFFCFKLLSAKENGREVRRFLLASGVISLILGLDDVFLLHEVVLPTLIGIPQVVILTSYGMIIFFYVLRFYRVILQTEYTLFLMAMVFIGISLAIDIFHLPGINPYLLEDGAKLIGLVSWFVYFLRTGEHALQSTAALAVCRS